MSDVHQQQPQRADRTPHGKRDRERRNSIQQDHREQWEYVVIDEQLQTVVYKTQRASEGLAFIVGRGSGVLCKVLCFGGNFRDRQNSANLEKH